MFVCVLVRMETSIRGKFIHKMKREKQKLKINNPATKKVQPRKEKVFTFRNFRNFFSFDNEKEHFKIINFLFLVNEN